MLPTNISAKKSAFLPDIHLTNKAKNNFLTRCEYPPILQDESWTLAVPYKERLVHRTPTESIANSYSPKAQHLQLKHLTKRKMEFPEMHQLSFMKRSKKLCHTKEQNESKPTPRVPLSRPVSPEVQLRGIYELQRQTLEKVTIKDIKRYFHYVECGIQERMIEPQNLLFKSKVYRRISPALKTALSVEMRLLNESLLKQAEQVYKFSLKKSIVDYVLLDPEERQRIEVLNVPLAFHCGTVRAPVPWHTAVIPPREFCRHFLFISNPVVVTLNRIWHRSYAQLRFINIEELKCGAPYRATELLKCVRIHCQRAKDAFVSEWLRTAANVFAEQKDDWAFMVPMKEDLVAEQADALFQTVAAFMSLKLRDIASSSLHHFMSYVQCFKDGNAYSDETNLKDFIQCPLMKIDLIADGPVIIFKPSLQEAKQELIGCIEEVVRFSQQMPRVEKVMFPELKNLSKLPSLRLEEELVAECMETLTDIFSVNEPGPQLYIKKYQKFVQLIDPVRELETEKCLADQVGLKIIRQKMNFLEDLLIEISLFRPYASLSLIYLNVECLHQQLSKRVATLKQLIVQYYSEKNRTINKRLCLCFEEMCSRAGETPTTTAELVELSDYLRKCQIMITYELKDDIEEMAKNLLFLVDFSVLEEDDVALNNRVFNWPQNIRTMIEMSNSRISMRQDQIEADLRRRLTEFDGKVASCGKELETLRKRDPSVLNVDEMKLSLQILQRLTILLDDAKQELLSINEEERLLGDEPTKFPAIQAMIAFKDPYDKLWTTALNFTEKHENWFGGPFKDLNAELIAEEVDTMWRTLYKLTKTFADYPGPKRVAENIKNRIEKFRQTLPVLQMICNSGMRERHWETVGEIVGHPIVPGEDASLEDMIEAGLPQFVQRMEEISIVASKEHSLEQSLAKMQAEWADVCFEMVPFRETGVSILKTVDDVQLMMDDHILRVQTIRSSPFVKPLEAVIKKWEEKLILMQDILDAWLKCQGTWMYLESIFGSEDIIKQMPVESRKFSRVDQTWREIMAGVSVDSRALVATSIPYMLQKLEENNRLLEEVQKGLNDYLNKKRLFFPRFFFLSNDELLEILSETKDPTRVQPHLKKCFEGIHKLVFGDEDDILAMISAEGERIDFLNKIYPAASKGLVEKWLAQVESSMVASLKDVTSKAIGAYQKDPLSEWIVHWPGQVVIVTRGITWTAEITSALSKRYSGSSPLPDWYRQFLVKISQQLDEIVELVRRPMDIGDRITLGSLIVNDVHARDVVSHLMEENVQDALDFTWVSQLRYYWQEKEVAKGSQASPEDMGISVRMVATDVPYGFEYLGNTTRLVITPLTDRCFRTLLGALELNLGGAPEGPAGTGKTETVKDLAKAVAKQCVVFNCSEGLDYHAMGKFFKGLAQAGAWACFDEFNRIDIEVLSVISQQIQSIQLAKSQKVVEFTFEGTDLVLNPSCAIFITMNPGYSGRQELPDNLKVLFRSVAMMVPDYGMIGEISLYSYGFVQARTLSSKIVHAYRLCSEQMSHQHHYDYGMRAVKAVLITAGNLKLRHPDQPEPVLVLKALRDVNGPKFLAQDAILFEGIVSDLFPKVELPPSDYAVLKGALAEVMAAKNLQQVPAFVDKILQIYDTMLVRHGLMIVGAPLSGKTTAYRTLAEALGKVTYKTINPKAVTLGQLYGSFDPASHEWTDGLLANTFREFAAAGGGDDRSWIVFDGPVDTVWVENMNTVLDDNKKLCLMNSEIIKMSDKMSILFETDDLEFASPATVSRCGMIYVEPQNLGWRAIKDSYLNTLPASVERVQKKMVSDIFDWLVAPSLDFVRDHCRGFVQTGDMHRVSSVIRLYDLLLQGMFGASEEDGAPVLQSQQVTMYLQALLLFALVWGIAGTLAYQSRLAFDEFFRNLLYGNNESHIRPTSFRLSRLQMFPEKKPVFDYVFECKGGGQWVSWMEACERSNFKLPPQLRSEMIIPTDETSQQAFFLSHCLANKIPLLLVGPTGTGKTAITGGFLSCLPGNQFVVNSVIFSARTTVNQTQDMVMSRLDRRRKGVYGPPLGRKCVVFIDDMNLPAKEKSGCQPPIELLRQWVDHGNWYDRNDTSSLELVDTLLVAAMGPPGRNDVTPRFLRHFHMLSIDSLDDRSLTKIFGTIVDSHFSQGYEPTIHAMSKAIVSATMSTYKAAINRLLPTPSKSHYIFNLRDFSRAIRGILRVPPSHLRTIDKLVRLWVHEVYRVFYDRLIDDDDRNLFFDVVKSACQKEFRQDPDFLFAHLSSNQPIAPAHLHRLFFGDYIDPDADQRVYDEIPDLDKLTAVMDYYLKEYNTMSRTPMSFVMFQYALEHVSRITRVFLQDQGHMLLFGISGSGRRSATKMAAFIANMDLHKVEISKNYGVNEWRDDVKIIARKAGVDGRPFVFLLEDNQIKDEAFLEDVNTILSSGDIPNLYNSEEKAEILEKMQELARELGDKVDSNPSSLYDYYVNRVRHNLHIVFTMSPVGDVFRTRLRIFPALINCCTISWFSEWPAEALRVVAEKYVADMDLDSRFIEKCITVCYRYHKSMASMSERYFTEFGRPNYITPTSYLEFLLTFKNLLKLKRNEILTLRNRYIVGLEKLDFAAAQVTVMQDELTAERPKLIKTTEETEKLMIKIEQDTIEVEAKKEVVAADEALANAAAAESQAIKDECENDLAEATPALESAIAALNTLKPQDITVIKSMKNPPSGVKLVMEAICIMKGIKPERKPEPGGSGKMMEDYWQPSQKMLGDLKFLDSLKSYNKDQIPPNIMKIIRLKYVSNPDFDPLVIRSVSMACEGLCQWICAVEVYDRVAKIVAPKKEKLRKAASDLGKQMEKLNQKRSQLQEVTDKLQILNDEFIKKTKEKKDLEDRIELCCKKLDRAEKLIGGLGGEKHRWSASALALTDQYGNVVGDVLLSAAIVTYLGAFTAVLRQECIEDWIRECDEQGIPCSKPYSLIGTLGNPVQIRDWNIAGLPIDHFSIDNAIIVSHSHRWPLMIDPQEQANKWIKNMEKENQLEVIKLSQSTYLQALEHCVQLGLPVLLEDVGQELDPLLQPLLLRQTFKQQGIECIRLSDNVIEYNERFKLYITTRQRNPHYLPEIAVKVTLLNFMITPIGLEEQLLGLVVAKEKPELEERKNELIVEGADNKRQLQEIEDKILEVLSMSEGNILEDETAIAILSSSKALSEEIKAKQEIGASTEQAIDETRNLYRPVATNASILFFCISELAHIDPMYQYSLSWFVHLYVQSIANCPKTMDLKQRTRKMNDYFTNGVYRNVCRSLFEKDKLVFSCILCIGLIRSRNQLDEDVWKFILCGGLALDNPHPNPASKWLSDKSWDDIVYVSSFPKFSGFMQDVAEHNKEWMKVYNSPNPSAAVFPAPWDGLKGLDKVAVLRCLRPDQLVKSIQDFICENLGQAYVETPAFDLAESYSDSSCCTPLIFILSPGADPMSDLIKFGQDQGYNRDRIHTLSLGQGQGPVARRLMESAVENGSWVVLQNCHLVVSWLPTLEKICHELIVPQVTHRNFRLWLTCYPCPEFPISLLQNGVKMTNEPPRGLRANIMRSYLSSPIADPSFFNGCRRNPRIWQRLLYGLCLFHAVVLERKNFGSLGWNIPYEFSDADLRISIAQLQIFLNSSNQELPLKALSYLTGELNYGGRVTDEHDRRLLLSLLSNFFCSDVISAQQYPLFVDEAYWVPSAANYEGYVDFLRHLPLTSLPSVLGLHDDASITKDKQETHQLLSGLLRTRPQQGRLSHPMAAKTVLDLASDILGKISNVTFNLEKIKQTFPLSYEQCMNAVLQQEAVRYNRLLREIRLSLEDVQKAVRGQIVMSVELEDVFHALLANSVPSCWNAVSYLTTRPLGGFVTDLLARLKFFQDWIDRGLPVVFWISGFFFTQAFLTGVLQNYARKHGISVDQLEFRCEIMKPETKLEQTPEDGAYIRGLFLEGARWDHQRSKLADCFPRVLYDPLPTVWLKPSTRDEPKPAHFYKCPVYKTSARRGELSTTGHSTNFVFSLDIPSEKEDKYWINRGVACLCQMDD